MFSALINKPPHLQLCLSQQLPEQAPVSCSIIWCFLTSPFLKNAWKNRDFLVLPHWLCVVCLCRWSLQFWRIWVRHRVKSGLWILGNKPPALQGISQQDPWKSALRHKGAEQSWQHKTRSTTKAQGRTEPEAVFVEFVPLLCLSVQLELSLLELLLLQELPSQPLLVQGFLLLPELPGLLCSLGSEVLLLQLLLISCFLSLCWHYLSQKCVSHRLIILSVIRNKQGETLPEGKMSSVQSQQSYFFVSLLEVKTFFGTQTWKCWGVCGAHREERRLWAMESHAFPINNNKPSNILHSKRRFWWLMRQQKFPLI